MSEIHLPEILAGLIFTAILVELTEWLPKLAEALTRALAHQMPKRTDEREREWLAMLDSVPGKWSKVIYSLSFIRVTLSSQESPLMTIIGLLTSSIRFFARIVAIYVIAAVSVYAVKDAMAGKIDMLPSALLIICLFLMLLPKDKLIEFSWVPEWKFNETSTIAVSLILLISSVSGVFLGTPSTRLASGIMCLAILITILIEVFKLRRSNSTKQ